MELSAGTKKPRILFSKLRMQYGTDKAKNKYLPLISKLRMQYGSQRNLKTSTFDISKLRMQYGTYQKSIFHF